MRIIYFLKKCSNTVVRVTLPQTCFDQNHTLLGYLLDEVTNKLTFLFSHAQGKLI